MPKTFLKRCCKCDRPIVHVEKLEWKWAKKKRKAMVSEDDPDLKNDPDLWKPICPACRPPVEPTILYPFSVWEVTETGLRHTLVDAPNI